MEVMQANKTELVHWNDNNDVTPSSKALSTHPLGEAGRRKKGGYINVYQPEKIRRFNECMEGVDLLDGVLPESRFVF